MRTPPTPERLLAAWSDISKSVPAEDDDIPNAVMFAPCSDPKVPCIAMTFQYAKDEPPHVGMASCARAMSRSGMLPAFLLEQRGVAAVSTSWYSTTVNLADHDTARAAYVAGDEAVREAISVNIYDAGAGTFTAAGFVAATYELRFVESYDEVRREVDWILSRIPAAWQQDANLKHKKDSA